MAKRYQIAIGETVFEVDFLSKKGREISFLIGEKRYDVQITAPSRGAGGTAARELRASSSPLRGAPARQGQAAPSPTSEDLLVAPMPGLVASLLVSEGQVVHPGEKIVILEAMKMENAVTAERGGKIKKIHVKEGAQVEANAPIVTFCNTV
ncbi:biotin/lipoyl-binding protein [bacterium]|nr:biotin/lipoyl-binding protein [bacterium]